MSIKKLLSFIIREFANIVRRSPWVTAFIRGTLRRFPILRHKIAIVVHAPRPLLFNVHSEQKIDIKMIKSADITDITEQGGMVYANIINLIDTRKS